MASSSTGPIGQVASWIEYPFTSATFPWKTVLLVGALIVLLVFFMHDGLKVISETVGEVA